MTSTQKKITPDSPMQLAKKRMHKLTALFILCCAADFLFYNHPVGISVAIFFLVTGLVSFATRKNKTYGNALNIAAVVLIAAILPAIEDFNWLSFSIAFLGTLWASVYVNIGKFKSLEKVIYSFLATILYFPIRFLESIPALRRNRRLRTRSSESTNTYKKWVMPSLLTLVFFVLFSIANPVLTHWLKQIQFTYIYSFLSVSRIIFWFFAVLFCWPFIRPYLKKLKTKPSKKLSQENEIKQPTFLLDEGTVTRALILFNILFCLQSLLDITYLWQGTQLPKGVTYSEYVHQGTYILIFTSLLAAAFILYVTHERRNYHHNPMIKFGLLAWTAQNVLLVLATISRMEIYIADYSLTELRIWALIWMFLVIVGLILIFLRLFMAKSNRWLIGANLIASITTLYLVSFVNMPHMIANYNLNIAKPSQVEIDVSYLNKLGIATLPAVKQYLAELPTGYKKTPILKRLSSLEFRLIRKLEKISTHSNWRGWTYRQHRLQNYFDKN